MSTFLAALRWDIVLQARNGFYWASAFVVLVIGGLLLALPDTFTPLLTIAAVAGVSAPLLALVLVSAAPDKVAGFAVVKVLNAANLLPIAAFFMPLPLRYIAGVIPTYWPMRALWSAAAGEPYLVYLTIGVMTAALAIVPAARLFERRLLMHG